MGIFIRASIRSSAAIALAASPALAVAGGPPIAYVLASGGTNDLYLSNPDGTGKVKLYSSANKVGIVQVDMRPGGNQLAIIEQSSASLGALKIINYTDAGVRQSVSTINSGASCYVNGVDYHPTDGSLIVSRHCSPSVEDVVRVAGGAYDATPIVSYTNIFGGKVRWINDGSGFLWVMNDGVNGGQIEHFDLSNTAAPVTVWRSGSNGAPAFFDVQRCAPSQSCDKMLVTTPYGGEVHEVSFSGGGTDLGTLYTSASSDAHYSPDNLHILWWHQVQGQSSIMIDNRVFVKASGTKDWRQ